MDSFLLGGAFCAFFEAPEPMVRLYPIAGNGNSIADKRVAMGNSQAGAASSLTFKDVKARTTPEEQDRLLAMFNSCSHQNADGSSEEKYITKEQFEATYWQEFKRKDLDVNRVFELMDTSKDGRLSVSEFYTGMFVFTAGSDEEKLRLLFNFYDLRGDGNISQQEMVVMMYKSAVHTQNLTMKPHDPAYKIHPRLKAQMKTRIERQVKKIFQDCGQVNRMTFKDFKDNLSHSEDLKTWFRHIKGDLTDHEKARWAECCPPSPATMNPEQWPAAKSS